LVESSPVVGRIQPAGAQGHEVRFERRKGKLEKLLAQATALASPSTSMATARSSSRTPASSG
jgi:hypothetical protein